MNALLWLEQSWETICICFGILVNLAGLAYNVFKLCRSGHARQAADWLVVLEAARELEKEAESIPGLTAAEKLQYVLSRLQVVTEELGCEFDKDRIEAQIEADIAFSKAVNARKSERLE
jgi:hypothetical protein